MYQGMGGKASSLHNEMKTWRKDLEKARFNNTTQGGSSAYHVPRRASTGA